MAYLSAFRRRIASDNTKTSTRSAGQPLAFRWYWILGTALIKFSVCNDTFCYELFKKSGKDAEKSRLRTVDS